MKRQTIEPDIEPSKEWVAVWAVATLRPVRIDPDRNSGVDRTPVRFGISKDPGEMLRKAREWAFCDVDLVAVLWVTSMEAAKKIKQALDLELAGEDRMGRSWVDVPPQDAQAIMRRAAQRAGVELYLVAEAVNKRENLRLHITKAVKVLRAMGAR